MSIKVRTVKDLENNIYSVKFEITDVSASDDDLIEAFGEPEIEIGGSFVAGPDTAVLPPAKRKLPSGFPVIQRFDGRDFTDAEAVANVFITDILSRLTTAVADLRSNADTFTGESVTTL